MKMKKIIAGFMVTVMLCGCLPALAENNETPEENLQRIGIIQGDPDGSLRLEDNITRAEFVQLVCNILGFDRIEASEGEASFTDVGIEHWANGYIYTAQGMGIINGYEDGSFRPEDNVTYEEAVKMIIVALGYSPFAADNGGYPNGYMIAASRYGVLENTMGVLKQPITRKECFTLIYNALDTPVMDQITYGAEPEYMILDGKNGAPLVTLRIRSGFEQ